MIRVRQRITLVSLSRAQRSIHITNTNRHAITTRVALNVVRFLLHQALRRRLTVGLFSRHRHTITMLQLHIRFSRHRANYVRQQQLRLHNMNRTAFFARFNRRSKTSALPTRSYVHRPRHYMVQILTQRTRLTRGSIHLIQHTFSVPHNNNFS